MADELASSLLPIYIIPDALLGQYGPLDRDIHKWAKQITEAFTFSSFFNNTSILLYLKI